MHLIVIMQIRKSCVEKQKKRKQLDNLDGLLREKRR